MKNWGEVKKKHEWKQRKSCWKFCWRTRRTSSKKSEVEEPELDFSLSCSDIREQIWNSLSDITVETTDYWGDTYTTTQYCLYDLIPDDKIAIVCDYSDKCKMFGVPYSVDDDTVKLDLMERKLTYVNGDQ